MSDLCRHHEICGGCSLWSLTYHEEKDQKIKNLQIRLQEFGLPKLEIKYLSVGDRHLRDRMDLQWRKGIGWGFFKKQIESKEIFSLETCLLLTVPLQKFYDFFKTLSWPYKQLSARLRVSPQGEWGLWLDMANVDAKDLLENQNEILEKLNSKISVIEIGQKRKRLVKQTSQRNGRIWQLDKKPFLAPWFQTSLAKGESFPLFQNVGSFSQVGFAINKRMVEEVLRGLHFFSEPRRIVELGAGVGNFTFACLSAGASVLALENDPLALEALKLNDEKFMASGAEAPSTLSTTHKPDTQNPPPASLQIQPWDFLKKTDTTWNIENPILLVDPPRSGLGSFLNHPIWHHQQVRGVIYVSCGIESWQKDLKELLRRGFQLVSLSIVDQFPRTQHLETVSVLLAPR